MLDKVNSTRVDYKNELSNTSPYDIINSKATTKVTLQDCNNTLSKFFKWFGQSYSSSLTVCKGNCYLE